MILIADSGASKTDWRFIHNDGQITQAQTIGFNPYYQSSEILETDIREVLLPQFKQEVHEVYFYGSGCSADKNRKIVRNVFEKHFRDAHIEIWHDLLAAARALCGNEPGIACILGTGANSCYYDGKGIVHNVSSLGFIMGDEGSGAYLGKKLLADYLRKDLPEKLWDRLVQRYELDKNQILDRVYKQAMPGRFLASFSKFIFQNIKEPYCHQLVYDSFEKFFKKNVLKYSEHSDRPIHFSGSVAFYFANILRQVGNDLNLSVKNVIESPIAGLTLYHQNSIK